MSVQLSRRGVCGLFQASLRNLPDFQCAVIARNDELAVIEGIPLEVHDIGSINKRRNDTVGKSAWGWQFEDSNFTTTARQWHGNSIKVC